MSDERYADYDAARKQADEAYARERQRVQSLADETASRLTDELKDALPAGTRVVFDGGFMIPTEWFNELLNSPVVSHYEYETYRSWKTLWLVLHTRRVAILTATRPVRRG